MSREEFERLFSRSDTRASEGPYRGPSEFVELGAKLIVVMMLLVLVAIGFILGLVFAQDANGAPVRSSLEGEQIVAPACFPRSCGTCRSPRGAT